MQKSHLKLNLMLINIFKLKMQKSNGQEEMGRFASICNLAKKVELYAKIL